MNVSELARKLRITTSQLHEALPHMGFDIGRRAIKIDNAVALKILRGWPVYQQSKKRAAEEAKTEERAALPAEKRTVAIPAIITVRDFAVLLNIPVTRLIQTLMNNGILAALNEKIDYDTAAIIAEDLGFIAQKQALEDEGAAVQTTADPIKALLELEDPKTLKHRPPVVVVMGHVDHGKTTLLDTLRKTSVVATESGGITQHIGAYQVDVSHAERKGTITFVDTPGHEAFTTMRSRGAKIADIAILVVAADDGVKPQTVEAQKIIQSAGIPMVVAINKIDKPDANLDRVKRELSDHGLIPEDWGGKTICVPISAKKNTGLDSLLDVLLLVAEMEKDKIIANPNGASIATVIESHIDKNEGPVATLLVQNGTFHTGDHLVIDNGYAGKIRAMRDHRGSLASAAEPSQPVRIIGFKFAPIVGFVVRAHATLPKDIEKEVKRASATTQAVVFAPRGEDGTGNASVNVILKTDTLGSLEAIANALLKIDNPEIKVKIVSRELGPVSSADVLKAEATGAFIAGFHVPASQTAATMAGEKNVEIKIYKVIYELLDDVRERIENLLSPETKRTVTGTGKVLKIFRTESKSMILGVSITSGVLEKDSRVTVIRGKGKITEGTISKIQSGKQEIKKAESGQECGVNFDGKPVVLEGDTVEAFTVEKVKRTLE